MTLPDRVEVLVVGAGPTGLAAACALQGAGVRVAVVDQAVAGTGTSRAAVVHARTLEVLEDLDVTRRLLAEGLVVPVFTVRDRDRVLARIDFGGLPTAHPYALMLAQSRTEAILTQRLGELGGRVHRPCQATRVTGDASGAEVTLRGPDGQQATVRARYVVGADGARSTVRQAAGTGFTGGRYAQSFVLADVRLRWPLPPGEVQLLLAPAGLVVVAPLPGGHHRVVATTARPEHVAAEDVQALLDQRGPAGAHVEDLVWSSCFRVHHRVADAYRSGPLLLAGDAAHVHSPAGGQGMNTGIQDALDLAATLHGVLRGGGRRGGRDQDDDALLDGYERRRRPVAQGVVTLTDRVTRLATLTDPAARTARDVALRTLTRLPPVRHRLALRLAELRT